MSSSGSGFGWGCLAALHVLAVGLVAAIFVCCGGLGSFVGTKPTNRRQPKSVVASAPAEPTPIVAVLPPIPDSAPQPVTPLPDASPPESQPAKTEKWLRNWNDKTGKFSTDAIFGGMEDGIVTLHKMDGVTVKVQADKLSDADREWIEGQQKEGEHSAAKTPPLVALPFAFTPFSSRKKTTRWEEGGTLHRKSALDWQLASDSDKLATCADFVAKTWDNNEFKSQIQKAIKSVDDMKPYAEELVEFLDNATKRFPDEEMNRKVYTNQDVAGLSVVGMSIMGWVKK
jgi:hypothetical protein